MDKLGQITDWLYIVVRTMHLHNLDIVGHTRDFGNMGLQKILPKKKNHLR